MLSMPQVFEQSLFLFFIQGWVLARLLPGVRPLRGEHGAAAGAAAVLDQVLPGTN